MDNSETNQEAAYPELLDAMADPLAKCNVAMLEQPLMRGEEALMAHGDDEIPIRHIMPDKGFVNFDDPIPLYVSGFGPKSLGLAGQFGDGAVLGLVANPAAMATLI